MILALALFTLGACAGLMYDGVSRAIMLIMAILLLFVSWVLFSEVDIFSFFIFAGHLLALSSGYLTGLYIQRRSP
ncbi:hypothetical protein [Bosea sp. (in: a-proteobacteria)]|jgi:hypothetical protein|uniref:hypothetical protein n=1 Tax=Bosea sp. (in: a-proteobacteria) TaxID=1871050 RepID=UPI002735AA5E|nr:hypothetical protein [Bosea sp. (in: a-proteobacteria)]MDP3407764.1 hypothetical protein [Bosea sp. (in: a-proteobacteria)]